ncbi:MAG: ATP-binding protein [Planctomycetota bacterium]
MALSFVGFYLIAAASYDASSPSVAYLVAATMVFSFGIFVLRHDPADPAKRAFLLLSLVFVGYILAVYLCHIASSWGMARVEWAVWLLRNGAFLAPPALLLVTYHLAERYRRLLRVVFWISVATMVPFVLLNLLGLYVTEYRSLRYTYVPANRLGLYAACAIVTMLWLFVACIAHIVLIFRSSSSRVRKQHLLFLVGVAAAILPSVVGFVPAFKRSWFPSYAGALIGFFPLILGIAVLRFDLFGIRLVIRKTLPYALGTTVIGGIYAASLGGLELLGPIVGGLPRGTNWFLLLAVMGIGFHPILESLRHNLDRLFFRSEAELDRFLGEAGPRYRDVGSQAMLMRTLAADAGQALNIKAAVVLIGGARVEHVDASSPEADLAGVVGLTLPRPGVGPMVSEDKSGHLSLGDSASELADALSGAQMRVVVIFGRDERRGILAVADKRSDLKLGPPDLLFLKALVAQAEMAWSNLRARAAASAATALTDTLFDVMANPVALVDSKGSILSCNPAFRHVFETSAGSGMAELGLDRILDHADLPNPAEIEATGGTFLVSARAVGGPSTAQRTLVVMTDVTDLRRLQDAERRQSALAELGTAISGINHEIMNILSPVGFYLQKAKDACDGEDGAAALSVVTQRIESLDRLCRDLRAYYRSPTLSLRSVHLGDLVGNALADLSQTQGPGWVPPHLTGLDVSVLADPRRLKQVLLNVIKNAWEAMQGVSEKNWTIGASSSDGCVVIRITDSGAGIPSSLMARLFEPFFTTKGDGGTGLGLAVAKRIAKAHGAEIAMDGSSDKGTTVTLRWPASR